MLLLKVMAVLCVASLPALLIPIGDEQSGAQIEHPFERYKAVEAYEIRPDVLLMPRYASNGQVCEIGIEKRHYSPEMIRHGDLSRREIDEIVAELVPLADRGAKSNILAGNELIATVGNSITTTVDYEKVTIEIYAWSVKSNDKGWAAEQDAAVLRWSIASAGEI